MPELNEKYRKRQQELAASGIRLPDESFLLQQQAEEAEGQNPTAEEQSGDGGRAAGDIKQYGRDTGLREGIENDDDFGAGTSQKIRQGPPENKQTGKERKEAASRSADLQDDAAIQQAYTVKDAPKYLAQVKSADEVRRLASLDTREGTKAAYEARLADLGADAGA